ncbi:MAG: alpha/beta hydrolase [SAR202 cluster bacterium]|nr:alpha/beta hydrolase [SAR202 cluster bacterium]
MITDTLNTNRISIYYKKDGNSSKNPYLLIHGLASNHRIWDLIFPFLSEDRDVIAIDVRGHGESEKTQDGYGFESISLDLSSFINQLGIKSPILVGHSWGGSIALHYAATNPKLVSGLIFIDGGLIDISSIPNNSLEKALVEMAPPIFTGITKEQLVEMFGNRSWTDRDSISLKANLNEIAISKFNTNPDGTVITKFSRESHLNVIRELWTHNPREFLTQIQCPTLNLPARMDQNTNDRFQRRNELITFAESNIKSFTTIWLENSIHDVPLQRPILVADHILNWTKNNKL